MFVETLFIRKQWLHPVSVHGTCKPLQVERISSRGRNACQVMIKHQCCKHVLTLSCLPSSGVLQQRLSSQDAAAEAVLPGCSSRASQQRALSCEEEGLVCFLWL